MKIIIIEIMNKNKYYLRKEDQFFKLYKIKLLKCEKYLMIIYKNFLCYQF